MRRAVLDQPNVKSQACTPSPMVSVKVARSRSAECTSVCTRDLHRGFRHIVDRDAASTVGRMLNPDVMASPAGKPHSASPAIRSPV